MGTHTSREPADFVIGDPDAPWALRLWRWWWLFPPVGLAWWLISPLLAVGTMASLYGLGLSARGLAPYMLGSRHGLVFVPQSERAAWHEARQSIGRIRAAWPALGAMADPTQIGPALDRARWSFAVLLFRRVEVTRALKELEEAVRGLGHCAGSPRSPASMRISNTAPSRSAACCAGRSEPTTATRAHRTRSPRSPSGPRLYSLHTASCPRYRDRTRRRET